MALQGTIDTFALPDVLRLLATSNKTGRLAVSGERGEGSIWVKDGAIVGSDLDLGDHPSTGSNEITEGLFQVLRFTEGDFTFVTDEAPDEATGPVSVETSINDAETMLTELNTIEKSVPGIRSAVSLSPEIEDESVTLTGEQWKILASVGAGTNVASIASGFGLGELEALRRTYDLHEVGVIDVHEPSHEAATAPVVTDGQAEEPVAEEIADEAVAETVDYDEAFAVDEPVETAAEDDPFFVADGEPPAADEEEGDPFAVEATTDETQPVDEVEASADEIFDPFAAPVDDARAADDSAVLDPFAPAEAETPVVDPSPFDEVATPGADDFDPFAAAAETTESADVADPFAPAGTDDAPAIDAFDPFAPTGDVPAADAGVVHDVFGAPEKTEADADWSPEVELADEVVAETGDWPAPNLDSATDEAAWSPAVAEDATLPAPPPPPPFGGAETADPFGDIASSAAPPPPADLPPPPVGASGLEAPDAEVDGVDAFPEPVAIAETEASEAVAPEAVAPAPAAPAPAAGDANDIARQLANLSPAAAAAVAQAARADTPAERDAALDEVEAEDQSVDRGLLLKFLKSDK